MSAKPDQPDLDDGRPQGEWQTRFPGWAWFQIILELVYLCSLAIGFVVILLDCLALPSAGAQTDAHVESSLLGMSFTPEVAKWILLAMSGAIGGTVFDLKWLYHSVAKGIWNRDRVLWRLIVPLNSAMVSLFTGLLFASGVIPFLNDKAFSDIYTLLGFGFVFGYFSDNILGALQNLALRVFGTLDSNEK